jgi:hypothetical protein
MLKGMYTYVLMPPIQRNIVLLRALRTRHMCRIFVVKEVWDPEENTQISVTTWAEIRLSQ